jgi:hypothetical protein
MINLAGETILIDFHTEKANPKLGIRFFKPLNPYWD